MRRLRAGACVLAALMVPGVSRADGAEEAERGVGRGAAAEARAVAAAAALAQVGVTLGYDARYERIAYPGGDVPIERGVCTDVVVRAFRQAGLDLQVLVHEDMRRNFAAYPRNWVLSGPDRNIDHRRVPNLARFFRRQGASLPITQEPSDYLPGDVVAWRLPDGGLPHVGIVADEVRDGRPLVVHNIGGGARLADVLFEFEITGHYRWPAK